MQLVSHKLMEQLIQNGKASQADPDGSVDHKPVVKFFTPDGGATWLISEADPENPDILFGLCDLGQGYPELGYVSLSEIQSVRGRMGLPIERDIHFVAKHPMSVYADKARAAGSIVGT